MKINDVTKTEDEALYETLDTDNDTGVSTDNLVKMVKAHRADNWSRYDNVEDFIKNLEELTASMIDDEFNNEVK